MLILNTSCKLWCHPCRTISVYGLGLWPYFFFIIIFLLQCGRWRRLAQTIYFFVPEKDVYNFVCILQLYCDTFNLGEKFPYRLETQIETLESRECSPSCQELLRVKLLTHTTGGSYTSVFGVFSVMALLVHLGTVHFSLPCLMGCHCR